jgi:hypothetical protein
MIFAFPCGKPCGKLEVKSGSFLDYFKMQNSVKYLINIGFEISWEKP